MTKAIFDSHGVCIMVSDHPPEPPSGGIVCDVLDGTLPSDVWYDGENVCETSAASLIVPRILDQGDETVTIELPEGAVANINGERHTGCITLSTDDLGQAFVDVRGALHGDFLVDVVNYAGRRKRAYPAWEDQLDTMYHEGFDVWKAQIQAVKDQYPKPE